MQLEQATQFGEFLVERRLLAPEALRRALEESSRSNIPLPAILLRQQLVAEKDLTAGIAHIMGMRFIDLTETPLQPDAARSVPEALARQYHALGVAFEDDDLVIAFAEPGDPGAVAALAAATGYEIIAAAGDRTEISRALEAVYVATAAPGPGSAGGASQGAWAANIDNTAAVARPSGVAAPDAIIDHFHINDLLERVLELKGSDLHLTANSHPMVRVHGDLRPLTEFPVVNGGDIRQMVYAILTQKQREKFETEMELDTSYSIPGRSRFRVNVLFQRNSVGTVMRVIPYEIVPFDKLGLPEAVKTLADMPRGLVLVTGPTGSGKSTTLASLVDIINREKPVHIMTVEDPIEFLHQHKRAIVNQREVGEDTLSFGDALKHALRQDPDVILVGEMRDLDTISTALTAAETGHLVFGTLHTQDAPQSIDRVIDVFPSHQQSQVRTQLAGALQGVVTQQLIPTIDGRGRAVASEVLLATPAIRNLIREGKVHQIYSSLQAGGRYGMQTMDQSLAALVKAGQISLEMGIERCASEDDLRRLVSSI